MTKTRLRELFKSILLVFLLISMFFLTLLTWIYDPSILPANISVGITSITGRLGIKPMFPVKVTAESRAESYEAAVYPVRYAARIGGVGYLAEFLDSDVELLRGRLHTVVGESLASSSAPVRISRREWEDALKWEGVYAGYSGAAPLSLYALMHGVELPEAADTYTDTLYLSVKDEKITLYYKDSESSAIFRSVTAAESRTLKECFETLESESFYYSFESDESFYSLKNEIVISEDKKLKVNTVGRQGVTINESIYELFLEVFELNPLSTYRHMDQSGTMTAVDDQRSLTFTADGFIIYTDNSEDVNKAVTVREDFGDSLIIEELRRIAAGTENLIGDAEISLRTFARAEKDIIVTFGYDACGNKIFNPDGIDQIYFKISNGIITGARIRLSRYAIEEEEALMLPAANAAVIANESDPDGFKLGICYYEDGDRPIPEWYSIG
jgi:hypothetical protein